MPIERWTPDFLASNEPEPDKTEGTATPDAVPPAMPPVVPPPAAAVPEAAPPEDAPLEPATGEFAPMQAATPDFAPSEASPPVELAADSHGSAQDTPLEVAEPFRLFHAHFGTSLCGAPVSMLTSIDGRPVQYFQNLALVAMEGGRVAPLPIGEAAFLARGADATDPTPAAPGGSKGVIEDLTGRLPRHPLLKYPDRPLAQIRHIVLHHTATSADVGPFEVAAEHVDVNRWPGIGYHFFVGADGRAWRTQDLNAQTFHARQFNPAAVGIALAGDYTSAVPPAAQLDAAADLIADLVRDLGLPLSSIRGHREIVGTPCPGDTFLTLWKPRLVRLVEARLAAPTTRAEAVV